MMKALMRVALASTVLVSAVSAAWAQAPQTDDDKTFYALGMEIGKSLQLFELQPNELAMVMSGLKGTIEGNADQSLASYAEKIRDIAMARRAKQGEKAKEVGAAFLAQEAAKAGAKKTTSGLIFTSVTEGNGPSPKATDKVKVHYKGTLINGEEFDSSYKRNSPAEFPLNRVIPCWTEGVAMMKVGGKARLVCPSDIAYGERGTPGIPPHSTLIFEVELLEIVAPSPAPKGFPAPTEIKPVAPKAKPAPAATPAPAVKPAPAVNKPAPAPAPAPAH